MFNLTSLYDYLRVFPQYLIPQHLLSRCIYKITRCKWPIFKNSLIKLFISCFNVDMTMAEKPDPECYEDFNHFFTRKLKQELRPITKDGIACPIDGSISQIGTISAMKIFQAKGRDYDLEQLLAADSKIIERFKDGLFATLYLSPRDYHRIHMPVDGILQKMIYVPGKLFAVNKHTTRVVNGLFARNERVISVFETETGSMAVIMVGAIFVGSMETVWAGQVTPNKLYHITNHTYTDGQQVKLKQGDELGRFNMGSTVILLFEKEAIEWLATACPDNKVNMGICLGKQNVKRETGKPAM